MRTDADEVLTIVDLSAYLKVSKTTLYKLAQDGVLPGTKVGKHWRFHKDAIVEWLRRHPRRGQTRKRNK